MADIFKITKPVTVIITDEVRCKFVGIERKHIEYFYDKYSILMSNYKFNPKYQLGIWDGKIQFFYKSGDTYVYLMPDVILGLKKLGYVDIKVDDRRNGMFYDITDDVNIDYFNHITNEKTNEPYQLLDHQIEAANKMIASGSGIALAGTGFGKAQPLFCKVLTPNGWTTMGELQVGDIVVTPTNNHATVLQTFDQGETDVYKIVMEDGGVTYAHPDHLWKVYSKRYIGDEYTVFANMTTLQMKELIGKEVVALPHLPCAIDFDDIETDWDPYIIGALLPFITYERNVGWVMKSYSPHGFESSFFYMFPKRAEHIFNKYGFRIKYYHKLAKIIPTNDYSANLFSELLAMIEMKELHHDYRYNSAPKRLRFLQGMCDMGGVLDAQGTTNIVLRNNWLYDAVLEMVQLQGGFVNELSYRRKPKGKTQYKLISFSHHIPTIYFSEIAKKEYYVNNYTEQSIKFRRLKRRVRAVLYEGKMQTKCILIDDPDHLYLTDNCIITHNTILNAVLVDKYKQAGCKTLTIVPATTLIKQTVKQFETMGLDVSHFSSKNPDIDHDHLVTTWQTLQNYPLLIKEFQMIVVDECLDGETEIKTLDGFERIKNIVAGDQIYSYNTETNKFEIDTVVKLHENLTDSSDEKMYELEFDNGKVIKVTGNHKVLTTNGYVRADELMEEHNVITF